jgi:hypothetical protein
VKRHFNPAHFAKLSERTLANYAAVLGLSLAQLRVLPPLEAEKECRR